MVGFKHSEETKRKMSLARRGSQHPMRGKKHTEESKQRMRESRLEFLKNGGAVWNNGLKNTISEKGLEAIRNAGRRRKGIKCLPLSKETREKISKTLQEKYKDGLDIGFRKKKFRRFGERSPEERKKISQSRLGVPAPWSRGANNANWKGGITAKKHGKRRFLQGTTEYRSWRRAVFERDDYTCIDCGVRGAKIQADHVKPYALFPELIFDINNGQTVCVPCHKKRTKKFLQEYSKGIFQGKPLSELGITTNFYARS